MKKKIEILKVGNFYFPYLDTKKKFIVENIFDITINGKDAKDMDHYLNSKYKMIHFSSIADIIWKNLKPIIKKEYKNCKNCWFVPQLLHKFNDSYECSIDILRRVK